MQRAGRILVWGFLVMSGGVPDSTYVALSQWRTPSGGTTTLSSWEECTIGVASGRATKDGRPMIWKTRDTDGYDNAVFLNTVYRYRFLAVIDAGNRQDSWMSLNERGFAILNSALYDLAAGGSGPANGGFMTYAAGTCASVAEFKRLLDSTNITGRRTSANFAVMDSTGAAAIFETGGYRYWQYDATDSITCPRGYVLRTNFSTAGGGSEGIVRFQRTSALFDGFYAGDSISPKSVLRYQMRDLADPGGVPFPLPFHGTVGGAPYGFIPVVTTICRAASASAAVIQGVLPGEAAQTSTFWTILGCPVTGIAIPYWLVCEPPLPSADLPNAPLNDTANDIYFKIWGGSAWSTYLNSFLLRDDNGNGLLRNLFQAEDVVFAAADTLLMKWRQGQCVALEVQRAESTYAAFALSALRAASNAIVEVKPENNIATLEGYSLHQNYPNPFNPSTTIRYRLPHKSVVQLTVFNTLGQQVAQLVNGEVEAGYHEARFDGSGVSSGVYFYRLQAGDFVASKGLLLCR